MYYYSFLNENTKKLKNILSKALMSSTQLHLPLEEETNETFFFGLNVFTVKPIYNIRLLSRLFSQNLKIQNTIKNTFPIFNGKYPMEMFPEYYVFLPFFWDYSQGTSVLIVSRNHLKLYTT